MSDDAAPLTGPDLAAGIDASAVPEGGTLVGHAHGEAVLLVRPAGADTVYAIAPACTHYGGPLADGLLDGHCLRCPWHHAQFDVRTGEAVAAPALTALARWNLEREGTRLRVTTRAGLLPARHPPLSPSRIVIVGAGAAGNAAAETLRREGYAGRITLIGAEPMRPVDRPNLSKDYLAGTAPEDGVPLHAPEFYEQRGIGLVLGRHAVSLDTLARRVRLDDGSVHDYDALLLATGADPVRLTVPGADAPHVFTLRTFADSRAIAARATAPGVKHAVVIGASFIALEAAASLRARGLEVAVVGREARPLQRVLGPELGEWVRSLHESHGVKFHLQRSPSAIDRDAVVLDDHTRLPADLVVTGVGVRPVVDLAAQAGLAIEGGVLVNARLETSVPGVYAAGDIARYPDARTAARLRIEHWVVAERQGQTAARNMLGLDEPFRGVPFFWSQHYDVAINYVGHAERWDAIEVRGSVADGDCLVAYRSGGRIDAIVTVGRDLASLRAERLIEGGDDAGLEALLADAGASSR